ncbi:hypothetical protein OVS_04345 [Mycoplasma ovis str. Michigan]|uniref:Uncharacterized protein n=1 Tax=Mycoplasma ovis str. Michigan TaxID=1415773 RepID=A0ABM5P2C9_9MOLU|nr:hypothetical protein OVS_04345 [Mycoplasma ovis str. Michigan]
MVGGHIEKLSHYPSWLRTVQKNPLIPEKDCQISQDDNKSSYSLTCNTKKVQSGIQI